MSQTYRLAVIQDGDKRVPSVERDGRIIPLAKLLGDSASDLPEEGDLMPILEDWSRWSSAIEQKLPDAAALFAAGQDAESVKFAPPIGLPGKLVCIGANYHDHINEMPIPMVPKYPYSFIKPGNNTVCGSKDPVFAPRHVKMMDYEAELAVVIGRPCANVEAADALDYVAGYMNFNDLSARDWIESRPPIGVDWVMHKGFDNFAPTGPYLLPARFVSDPQDMAMKLTVNGEVRQNSSTAQMVYGVADCIAHLSSVMTMMPGDVIGTGTPAGVAHGHGGRAYIKAGDEIRLTIAGLGELVTPVI